MTREEVIKELENMKKFNYTLAPLEVFDMAIKALWAVEHMPTTKNDLGVDCISRTRTIERLKLNFPISQGADNSRDRHRYMQALADIQAIREMPAVTPQEPFKPKVEIDLYSVIKQKYIEREVLDKIRAEIEQLSTTICTETRRKYIDADDFKENVLAIFDKYKAESEAEDGNDDS